MLLQLDNHYRIVSDKYNFILERNEEVFDRKTKESKGFEYKQVGFFGTNLAQAIKKYSNEKIKDEDKILAQQLLYKLDEINKHIDKVVKKENIDFVYTGKKDDE